MSTHDEDKKIVALLLNKDERALGIFYKTYYQLLFGFIARRLPDTALAEELTQDVFIDFLEALRDFRFQSSVKTFLFSIAKNKIIDVIRKKKIKKILFSSLPAYFVEELASVMFDETLEKKELTLKIKNVFDSLPNDYQVVLRLKYIEGEKVKKISQKLTLGFKATESLIFRARKAFTKSFHAQ
ncbi:MAG: sigma-70 family RNA polymerase sigma factor [bacterium]|nr:sigma-70 family RNA polymerase sigma factor [bacterium]